MSDRWTVALDGERLTLLCGDAEKNSRTFTPEDRINLDNMALTYAGLLDKGRESDAFLGLGRELGAWLDGSGRWLARILEEGAQTPLAVEFRVARRAGGEDRAADARAFLAAPWEVLAEKGGGFLALDPAVQLCPVRRIGEPQAPPAPTDFRLGLAFMAAAPRGEKELDFEAEETAILSATEGIGLDLAVEESGVLEHLADRLVREPVDVVHLSCHGGVNPHPLLVLEDPYGNPKPAAAEDLAGALGETPRLLFLSACRSAQAKGPAGNKEGEAGSAQARDAAAGMAEALCRRGFPAALGWSGKVYDHEASEFAARLYRDLAGRLPLEKAVARARYGLFEFLNRPHQSTGEKPTTPEEKPRSSRDWHLARLFLGPRGGGPVCGGSAARGRLKMEQGYKEFLDADKKVPVAGRDAFVGRRRHIQTILREFRSGGKGVYIHGLGQQGKSSLAARVAHRMPDHKTVVAFGRYDHVALLNALANAGGDAARNITCRCRGLGGKEDFYDVLGELLEGPFRQKENGKKPALLVLDDFERALEDPAQGEKACKVQSGLVEDVRDLIRAFRAADTDSRLLFTSRYEFELESGDRDWFGELLPVQLAPMDERGRLKQARARDRAAGVVPLGDKGREKERQARIARIMDAARGNCGLQDRLHALALADPAACDRALHGMEAYLKDGKDPEQEDVRQFLEGLYLGALMDALSPVEKEALRLSTLFFLPVPAPALAALAEAAGLPAGEDFGRRLCGLGVWDRYEDLFDPSRGAFMVNPLVRPKAGQVQDEELSGPGRAGVEKLFALWGGEAGRKQRPSAADLLLADLGLRCGSMPVLGATARDAVAALSQQNFPAAADFGLKAVAALQSAPAAPAPSTWLLQATAEACRNRGDMESAERLLGLALERLAGKVQGEDPEADFDYASILLSQGGIQVQRGKPDEALVSLEEARDLFAAGGHVRDRAITLGDIARIYVAKGRVDAALAHFQEAKQVYEELGDRHSRAVTLGDIARIYVAKGRVDEALALHQEELKAYEELGDRRSRAVTLGDIARISMSKGRVDEALALHQEELKAYEELGDRRSRAVTLGDIARIYVDQGRVDAALALLQEKLKVAEDLGDRRSRAVALGDIARIYVDKGRVDEALALQEERLAVNTELDDVDGMAAAHFDLFQLCHAKEDYASAGPHLVQAYAMLLQLGRLDGICIVGQVFGQLFWNADRNAARAALDRSIAGFGQLGWKDQAEQTRQILAHLEQMGEGGG